MKALSVFSIAAALGLAIGTASAGERPKPLANQEDVVAKSLTPCPGGLERFLPGDYYFCTAAQNFWSGHPGLTRESLKTAAGWASKPAQYALGLMYFNGDRAEKNRPLGLAWLAIAAERHDPAYEPAFISAYKQVSTEELAQANTYWNEMKKTYADDVAAPRAEKRFDREYQQVAWATNFGGSIFVDGLTLPAAAQQFADAPPMQTGFSLGRLLESEKAMYFYGYDSHVYVGDAQLLPVSQVVGPQERGQ
jgi:TPR repeat protein